MSKRKGSFLLLGALIGFIAGLFLAPKKGSELRKDAKNKIDEIKENPKEVLHETLEDVKEKINGFIDDNFKPVILVDQPTGEKVLANVPPILPFNYRKPVKVTKTENSYIYDYYNW